MEWNDYMRDYRKRNRDKLKVYERERSCKRRGAKLKQVMEQKPQAFPALVLPDRVIPSNAASPAVVRKCQHSDKNGYPACKSMEALPYELHGFTAYYCKYHFPS